MKRGTGRQPARRRAGATGAADRAETIRRSPNINMLWASLLIEELVRCGVTRFWVAPGSHSTPLVVAVARHPVAKATVHFDERGMAFHAMGFAAASNTPVALICTSGTAVANLLPTVVEASKKKLPLILLTADRPPELRHAGSHQTVDQIKIFGASVRWEVDLPCPTTAIDPAMVLTTIDQAVVRAGGKPAGPVHINTMFREPLAPVKTLGAKISFERLPARWLHAEEPYTTYTPASVSPPSGEMDRIASVIEDGPTGVVVAGKLHGDGDRRQTVALARHLGWPLFPDMSSGLRLGCDSPVSIQYFDRILAAMPDTERQRPRVIIHVGGRITSKHWYRFAAESKPDACIMALSHDLRSDPFHMVTHRLQASPGDFCRALRRRVTQRAESEPLVLLRRCNEALDELYSQSPLLTEQLTEPAVARTVSRLLPEGAALFSANSLSLRLLDMYAVRSGSSPAFGANRGASGIDGTVASAAGFSLGLDRPLTLLIGDQALLHDLNSLALLRDVPRPFTLVLLNNGGGGVFSLLPIARFPEHFDRFFTASHNLTFEHAAAQFGLRYARPGSLADLDELYREASGGDEVSMIEVVTRPGAAAREIESLDRAARDLLRKRVKTAGPNRRRAGKGR